MIRDTVESDTDTLVAIAAGTGVFKPLELAALHEVLDDYHATERDAGHRAITFDADGRPVGFAYFAPTPMTDRTWHLYWIFVDRAIQARGIGAKLMDRVEAAVAAAGGRMLVVETSGLPSYEPTRRFYRKLGYDEEGTVRDFYADGDDMVIFRKRLA